MQIGEAIVLESLYNALRDSSCITKASNATRTNLETYAMERLRQISSKVLGI